MIFNAAIVAFLPSVLGASLPVVASVAATSLATQGIIEGTKGLVENNRLLKPIKDTLGPSLPLLGSLAYTFSNNETILQNSVNTAASFLGGATGNYFGRGLGRCFFKPKTDARERSYENMELGQFFSERDTLLENQALKDSLTHLIENLNRLKVLLGHRLRETGIGPFQRETTVLGHILRESEQLHSLQNNAHAIETHALQKHLEALARNISTLRPTLPEDCPAVLSLNRISSLIVHIKALNCPVSSETSNFTLAPQLSR